MIFLNVGFGIAATAVALLNHVDAWVAGMVMVFAFLSGLFTGLIASEL